MKKLIILLLLATGGYFALAKWSPRTLEQISFWRQKAPQIVSAEGLPAPEPPPLSATAPQKTATQSPATAAPEQARQTAVSAEPAHEPPPVAPIVDKTAQVVVLLYHRVEPVAQTAGDLNIAPEVFEQHMQKLKDSGISVISMADFLAWRRGEKTIPPRSALITIDDGYVSTFDTARPILKKFGYPWTCFIYTKYIASGGKSMTWEQLAKLRDEGVEIGCHTASHQDLREPRGKSSDAYEQWLRDEIVASKSQIEQRLGIRCRTFAYPYGGWNSRVIEIVREAGYDAAFTVYGQRITHSAPAERIGRYAWSARRPQDIELAFRFSGPLAAGNPGVAPAATPAPALLTQPLDGETITDPQPELKANLSQIGGLDPASVAVRLSGVGLIPHKLDPSTLLLESRPPEPLAVGDHTVIVTARAAGKRFETQWSFTVEHRASAGQ